MHLQTHGTCGTLCFRVMGAIAVPFRWTRFKALTGTARYVRAVISYNKKSIGDTALTLPYNKYIVKHSKDSISNYTQISLTYEPSYIHQRGSGNACWRHYICCIYLQPLCLHWMFLYICEIPPPLILDSESRNICYWIYFFVISCIVRTLIVCMLMMDSKC